MEQNADSGRPHECRFLGIPVIGSGIGGLLAGILGMTQYVISTPGFISLPAYIDPTGSSYNLIVSVIVMIVAVVLGFVATYALGKRAEAKK